MTPTAGPSRPKARAGGLSYSAASVLGDNERPGGISVQEAEKVVERFRAALSGAAGLDFRVYRSQEEAFGAGASREKIRSRIKGATLPRSGTVLLIAGNLRDMREVWAILIHEVLAHHGLNLFPPEIKQQILERIAASRWMPGIGAFFREVERGERALTGTRQAAEVFARIIEQGPGLAGTVGPGFGALGKLGTTYWR